MTLQNMTASVKSLLLAEEEECLCRKRDTYIVTRSSKVYTTVREHVLMKMTLKAPRSGSSEDVKSSQ